jgi:hypothetical protein
MSEAASINIAVLAEDAKARADREVREEKWMTTLASIHVAMFGCLDDGPSVEAIALARELAKQLTQAVDDFLN